MTDPTMTKRNTPKCRVCNGSGYLHCECWPCDCICGMDYEPCGECEGSGFVLPDEYDGYQWRDDA